MGAVNTATTDDASGARVVARTTSETADAYMLIDVTRAASPGSNSWKVGSNGDNDGAFEFRNFVNASIPTLQGTLRQNIDRTGQVTFPTTACFLSHTNPNINNVTGDGTTYSPIIFNIEVFDQDSNYDPVTGIFTAPVTGRYNFQSQLQINQVAVSHTTGFFDLITSNRTFRIGGNNPGAVMTTTTTFSYGGSCTCDMDAGDTALMSIVVDNGALVIDIQGGPSATSFFGGELIA